jgi:hypothetical protein
MRSLPPQAREAAQGIARLVLEGMREEGAAAERQLRAEVGTATTSPPRPGKRFSAPRNRQGQPKAA